MAKVLLIGARLGTNLGGPSLLPTTIRVIEEALPGCEYTYISPDAKDTALAETYGVRILPSASNRQLILCALAKAVFGLSVGTAQARAEVQALAEADVVIDIWGIAFADSLGSNSFRARASGGAAWLAARILRKPVVKWTADLGPFQSRWNRFFAKLYLQYLVKLIVARSAATQQRLQELGVTVPVRVCPDTAFLLEARSSSFADALRSRGEEHPVVGFSVSHMAARQAGEPEAYFDIMAQLADYVVDSIGAKIVLIPNELSAVAEADDAHVAREVWGRMARRTEAVLVLEERDAPELKAILGACDVAVAARYHSIVACLSLGVPVLAIGWHAKYAGVMSLFGQEQYVCSLENLTLDFVRARFDALWQSRDHIRRQIKSELPGIRRAILETGKALKPFVYSEQ